MSEVETRNPHSQLQGQLARVGELLRRQHLVENLAHRQQSDHHDLVESLVHRQHVAELQREIARLRAQNSAG